jgi:hypothetical protein
MKPNTRSTKLLTMAIAVVAAVAIWTSWSTRQVQAIQDSEDFPPPFGLAQGQTARLTVLNRGEESGIVIEYRFLNSAGGIVGETPEPHLIPPGQFRSFDFNLPNPPPGTVDFFGRIQVRAVVSVIGNPEVKDLRISLEVFDNATGRTSFVISPPPDPD